MRKVSVVPYSPDWVRKFMEEAKGLKMIFQEHLIEVHHIGSTSVSGLSAKPVIDLLPVVKSIQEIDVKNGEMAAFGYEALWENGIPGRRFFQKGGDNRTHHVHVYEVGSPEIDRHLAFRDYLLTHPAVAFQYGKLKERLAKEFPYEINSYIEGKSSFVSSIEKEALKWRREAHD